MKSKCRYIWKYAVCRFLPDFLLICILSAMLIFLSGVNGDPKELTWGTTIGVGLVMVRLAVFAFHITSFLCMIGRQEKQYNAAFSDKNAHVLSKLPSWIICSQDWLIQPGKRAICRKDIRSVSMRERHHQKGGMIYPVRIKTWSGKAYIVKTRSNDDAKTLKKWAGR